jgi:predicted exporter
LLSSFTGLSQLGVLIVVGVLAAGLVTRWVVPALAPRTTMEPSSRFANMDWIRGLQWIGRGHRLLWLGVAAALSFLIGSGTPIWDDDLANLSPVSQSAKALDEQLRAELGAPDVRFLLIMTANSRDKVLALSESADTVLRRLVDEGMLAGFDLPSLYVPSRETQERRRAALPSQDTLRVALRQALQGMPFRAGLFEPFVQDVARARTAALLDPADLEPSALSLKLRALLLHSGNEWTVLAPLRGVTNPAVLAERIEWEGRRFAFLDLKEEADRLVARYRHESLRLTAIGLAAITAVLWLGLRRVKLVGRVLFPPLIGVLFTVTGLLLAGERLSLFHLVSLLLVMGIGLNYALFFQRGTADEADRRRTSLSLAVCIAATVAAFGTLATSQTPVLHAIGITVSLGAVASLILSAMLAKPTVTT